MQATDDRPHYDRARPMLDSRARLGEAFARQALMTSQTMLGNRAWSELAVLDVGCGYGYTSAALSRLCRRVVGLEPSSALAESARTTHRTAQNLAFVHGDLLTWRTEERFDLVILDNVYEHIPDHAKALSAISTLLNPGGAFYILVPNRLWPLEPHYRLPFLSYLPLPIANQYLRITKRGEDYTDASYSPTYWSLKRELDARPELEYAFTLPADLSLTQAGASFSYRIGAQLIRLSPLFWSISKSLLVVGRKKTLA
jgi:SAM-dependent methyltransferase